MKKKLIFLTSVLLIALTGCNQAPVSNQTSAPSRNGPIVANPAQESSYALEDVEKLFITNGINLSDAGNSNGDWILNGIKPSNYYYSCGPASDCKRPQEYISIYIFKDVKAREKGFEDFNKQREKYDMVVPIVWAKSNALVLYWHHSALGEKTVLEEQISKALAGWDEVVKHERSTSAAAFDDTQAVTLVLKDHPDFPKAGEVKKIETTTGGPDSGTKYSGELKTTVEKSTEPNSYVVTLTKAWNITVNGKEAKSVWKYKVTRDGKVELISSVEDDALINTIK